MKTVKSLTLYHGSTVGWLHISGFKQAKFPYGEFTDPHPFVFLCTDETGGKSAAHKSFTQVSSRNPGGPPASSYCYKGISYPFKRYLYEVDVPCGTEYLDFHAEKLTPDERRRVFLAMSAQSKGRILKSFGQFCAQIDYIGCPNFWVERLRLKFEKDRNALVGALADNNFCLIRNFERDGDGQGYGEVWCAPMKHTDKLILKTPRIIK